MDAVKNRDTCIIHRLLGFGFWVLIVEMQILFTFFRVLVLGNDGVADVKNRFFFRFLV